MSNTILFGWILGKSFKRDEDRCLSACTIFALELFSPSSLKGGCLSGHLVAMP